jgi:HEAT repeat protein
VNPKTPGAARAKPAAPSAASPSAARAKPAAPSASPSATPPSAAAPGEEEPQGELKLLHLSQVKEIVRHFLIAEKHLRLYPPSSKVVEHATQGFFAAVRSYLDDAREPLHIHVSQTSLIYRDEEVYHEDVPAKSMAHRLFKDGIRGVIVHEEAKEEELKAFLLCFKETIESQEEEDDFGTVFWEKDCTNVQLQLIDDAEEAKDEEQVRIPTEHLYALGFDPTRFAVTEKEERELKRQLGERQGAEQGDDAFEIAQEEIAEIKKLSSDEETYFAIYDFVDILIEHMARNRDVRALEDASRLIKEILQALIENFDFEHASSLLEKVCDKPHPALTELQLKTIRETVGDFCDPKTLKILDDFLKESKKLAKNHPVFTFLRLLGRDAISHICQFMAHEQHIPALSKVLVEIGKNGGTVYAKHMMSAGVQVARAMIYVILQTDGKAQGLERIAKALKHQEEEVRKIAAKTILEHGDQRVGAFFLPLLDDPPLFSTALQFYAKVAYPHAYLPLEKLVRGKGFHHLDHPRQALCFKALILADAARSLGFIRGSVLRWPFAWGRRSRQRKVAALRALAYHRSEEAREILFRFSERKRSPLAGTAEQALRLWDKEEQEPGSAGEAGLVEEPAGHREPVKEVEHV